MFQKNLKDKIGKFQSSYTSYTVQHFLTGWLLLKWYRGAKAAKYAHCIQILFVRKSLFWTREPAKIKGLMRR